MKRKLQIPALLFTCGLVLFGSADLFAQGNSQGKGKGNSKKQKDQKEYRSEGFEASEVNKTKAYKVKKDKTYKNKGNAKKFPNASPRQFKVPPGHYPPAGTYRIWYPGRPPGHQPAPVAYGHPPNAPITDGAFILHGNKAYDTQYDWRREEVKKPRSVPREVIDILFPENTIPAQ